MASSWWHLSPEGLVVGSALVDAELPDGSGRRGLQWHVSVSQSGARPSPEGLALALRDFGMTGAEEDNHHPGVARHFWRPLDPKQRVACECKATETVVVEPDGYRWTNPSDAPCRGCELAAMTGAPRTLHSRE